MDWLEKAISPLAGEWAPWILLSVAIVVWFVTKALPAWIQSRGKSLRGSPSSERHWRSRLAEALEQYDPDLSEAERTQLAERVTRARTMVEAHEARRRLGLGGVAGMWAAAALLIASSIFWGGALVGSIEALVIAIALGVGAFAYAVLAVFSAMWIDARVLVLAEAGQRGHSDLVRDDPWRVLRGYEQWATQVSSDDSKQCKVHDKKHTRLRTRIMRTMLGLSSFPSTIVIDEDIWANFPEGPAGQTGLATTRSAETSRLPGGAPTIGDADSNAPEAGA